MVKTFWRWIVLALAAALPLVSISAQSTDVTAEPVGQANLRATTATNAALLGEIFSGTRYPVLARSECCPWLLLGDPTTLQPIGWVYQDLLTVYGNINTLPTSTVVIGLGATPTLSSLPTGTVTPNATSGNRPPDAPPTATLTPLPPNNVIGTAQGEINVRFGPGVEYPRVGVARAGEQFIVTGYHTQFPWIQIRYAQSPNGFAWVANDLLVIQGDIFSTSAISQTRFVLPALSPTPQQVVISAALNATPINVRDEFTALGEQLWEIVLDGGFDPQTSRLGALYLMDLQTGEAISFGGDLAFSGMSINKISILVALYAMLNQSPDLDQARIIAETMICSDNAWTNRMLEIIGEGDLVLGAQRVTDTMRALGMADSFMLAPYRILPEHTPVPVAPQITFADQTRAAPDIANQLTVDDMGGLLAAVYQCAFNESGILLTTFPNAITSGECRQMLNVMSYNRIGEFIEAGVPTGTRVAHKHGWVDETHGDAGIVWTPNGDYVLVVALHAPEWLDFEGITAPTIAEVSRTVYNHYNPSTPLDAINRQTVPLECTIETSLLEQLQRNDVGG